MDYVHTQILKSHTQAETNTKIAIRGKGSVKEGAKREDKYDYGEDEELHVMITGNCQSDVSSSTVRTAVGGWEGARIIGGLLGTGGHTVRSIAHHMAHRFVFGARRRLGLHGPCVFLILFLMGLTFRHHPFGLLTPHLSSPPIV